MPSDSCQSPKTIIGCPLNRKISQGLKFFANQNHYPFIPSFVPFVLSFQSFETKCAPHAFITSLMTPLQIRSCLQPD